MRSPEGLPVRIKGCCPLAGAACGGPGCPLKRLSEVSITIKKPVSIGDTRSLITDNGLKDGYFVLTPFNIEAAGKIPSAKTEKKCPKCDGNSTTCSHFLL